MEAVADREKTTVAQKIAWFLFCTTCLQLVFLKSYVTVITGVKADVFSGALCTLTFAACVLVADTTALRLTLSEILVCLAFIVLGATSGVLSSTPWSASLWTYVSVASSLGGFWCGRIVLNTPYRQKIFVWLCAVSLIFYALFGFWGYYYHARADYFIDDAHLAINLILLLSFSVLSLMAWRKPVFFAVGIGILGLAYGVLYLCGMSGGADSGVLVPMGMIVLGCSILAVRSGSKAILFTIVFAVAIVSAHYIVHISLKNHSDNLYQAQRLESYSFAGHIAQKHPLFGIGLRTPRVEYLADYEMRHPYYTKEQFTRDIAFYKTLQNTLLTIMVDLGIPFLLLYGAVLTVLFVRLARAVARSGSGEVIPPLVLLIPLTGALLHLFVMDLLLMSQIAWFFHVLLGMIPSVSVPRPEKEFQPRAILGAAATAVVAVVLGALVGTHQALDPKQLPTYADVSAYVENLPLVRPFVAGKPTRLAEERPEPGTEQSGSGAIVVNVRNFVGARIDWRLLCILDNSTSMARHDEPWNPNRLHAATYIINSLTSTMPAGSGIGVRGFVDQGPLVRRDRELGLRVSRLLHTWTNTGARESKIAVDETMSRGTNNVCAAAEFALERDFQLLEARVHPRVLILTDGGGGCDPGKLGAHVRNRAFVTGPALLDVIAIGMKDAVAEKYSEAVVQARGVFIKVDQPGDLPLVVSRYLEVLNQPVRRPLVVLGASREWEIWPGDALSLPAGSYSIALSANAKSRPSRDWIEGVRVRAGETRVMDLEVVKGRIVEAKPDRHQLPVRNDR